VCGGPSFAKLLIDARDAEEAVNPRVSLLAVHTCGKVGVERGVRAFVASSQKVRSDGICLAAGGLDSFVQRIGFDDPTAYML
jgi:hypothetical protein